MRLWLGRFGVGSFGIGSCVPTALGDIARPALPQQASISATADGTRLAASAELGKVIRLVEGMCAGCNRSTPPLLRNRRVWATVGCSKAGGSTLPRSPITCHHALLPVPVSSPSFPGAVTSLLLAIPTGNPAMAWRERWRWLHRIRGILASLQSSTFNREPLLSAVEAAAADSAVVVIESLRALTDTPDDMACKWAALRASLDVLMLEQDGDR